MTDYDRLLQTLFESAVYFMTAVTVFTTLWATSRKVETVNRDWTNWQATTEIRWYKRDTPGSTDFTLQQKWVHKDDPALTAWRVVPIVYECYEKEERP